MEKFGIFELLDALAAMTEDPPKTEKRTPDAAFDAPSYGEAPKKEPEGGTAVGGFLDRHERASRRIKK